MSYVSMRHSMEAKVTRTCTLTTVDLHRAVYLLIANDCYIVNQTSFINYELQKIEKLQSSLGFLDEVGPTKLAEKHTIFVSDEEEAEQFDPEEFFNTPKELLTRAYNRPTKEMIEKDVIIINKDKVSKKDLNAIEKAKASSYKVSSIFEIFI